MHYTTIVPLVSVFEILQDLKKLRLTRKPILNWRLLSIMLTVPHIIGNTTDAPAARQKGPLPVSASQSAASASLAWPQGCAWSRSISSEGLATYPQMSLGDDRARPRLPMRPTLANS